MSESERKPAILLLINDSLDQEKILDILYGMEEEGIPYQVKIDTLTDPFKLAYEASQESNLSVGIGCSNNKIILTQRNIPLMNYIMKIKLNDGYEYKRSFGVNAARLVKGIAFKNLKMMEV